MGFLKGLALSLLGFFLFLSLSIFGLLLTLNSTILNPDFIVDEIDKLDISSLAEEFLTEETAQEEFSVALIDTVSKVEPLVKEQVSAAIYPVYDYLLGKSESLDLALVLGDTFLNSDFVASLLDEVDIASLAGGFLTEQLTEQIPEEYPEEYRTALVGSVDDVIVEFEPWIKEQVNAVAPPILDYLLGESQSLNEVISLEPVIENLPDTLTEAVLESLAPEIAHLSPAERAQFEQYLYQMHRAWAEGMLPPTFELNESVIGPEVPAQIAQALAEAEEVLEEARQYVGYFQLGYKLLIGLILLLIVGIVFLYRQVKGATRGIGIIFLSFGALEYLGIFAAKYFAGTQLAQLDIPAQLQEWLPQFLNDFLAPLGIFSIALLIGGVALIVVSFVYKPRQPSP